MAIVGLFTGGTTGARDGTLISSADSESAPFAFGALNATYTLHYRSVASTASLVDTGYDSVTAASFMPPANVSVKVSASWIAGPTLAATITGGNKALYVKQTALSDTAALNLGVGAIGWKAGTRVGQVGTVTPTVGNAQVTLAWSAVSGATSYDLYQSTSSTNPIYGYAPTVVGVTSGYVRTGLTNGTQYYFWIRANSTTGAGAWSASCNATPIVPAEFSDNFDRSNGSLGSNWTNKRGTGTSIVSNKAQVAAAGNYAVYNGKSNYTDVLVQFTFASGGGGYPGIVIRSDGSNNDYGGNGYFCYVHTNALVLTRMLNGSGQAPILLNLTPTLAAGATVKVTIVGSTITAYVNGTPVGSASDGNLASGYVGICGANANDLIDDFYVSSL